MTDFLLLATIFLVAGVIAVPIASRLGLGSVLGYLIAGIVISPILGWLHVDVISIQHFAEFGVVMMLFLVGLGAGTEALVGYAGQAFGTWRIAGHRNCSGCHGHRDALGAALVDLFGDRLWSLRCHRRRSFCRL